MSKYFNNWKHSGDKEIQQSIEIFNSIITNCNLSEIQNDIDFIVQIIKSSESSYGIKLRFGSCLFLSISIFGYPYQISDFLQGTIDEPSLLLTLLNGVIDYKTTFDHQSLFKDFELLSLSYFKLDLFFSLLFQFFQSDLKQYYHLILLIKKAWQILERAHAVDLFNLKFNIVEKIVRYFIPFLDSSISGLTALISNLFQTIIKWSFLYKDKYQVALEFFNFFSRDLLNEFYPFIDGHNKFSSYSPCKIHLRYLKIVVQGCGLNCTLTKLPFLFHYLLQTISVNYTATLSGDIFLIAFKQLQFLSKSENLKSLIDVVEQFMIDGCHEFWYEDSQRELQTLNFATFVIVNGVKYHLDEMVRINDRLLERLMLQESKVLFEHNLFMWITSFAYIYPEIKSISEEQMRWINKSLWHSKDHIRITAYKFICENYSVQIASSSPLNLSSILNVLVNNLTSDNPGFRNHMISATKRLFVVLRDSVVPHLGSDADNMMNDITAVKNKMDHFFEQKNFHFELFSWNLIEEMFIGEEDIQYKDIALFVNFCRLVYCQQWFAMSMNYQRQRSLIDLIIIIRDVIVDDNFFIDKKCGFGNKTVLGLQDFYRNVRQHFFISPLQVMDILLYSITITKSDVQNDLFALLLKTYSEDTDSIQTSFDWNDLWRKTQALCHSNQPMDMNAGSIYCSFLSHSDYLIELDSKTVIEYLVNFLEHLASIEIDKILVTSLRTPGHGFLMSLNYLVRHCKTNLILKSDHIPLTAMRVIKLMLKFMGCEDDDLASFQKMGISMNSIASNDCVKQSIGMNIQYQHVLSWTWQVLRNTCSILISWCQCVVENINSSIFREIGLLLVKILCQNRHRGTIECVADCLQTYIQLGEKNGLKDCWLSAREIAINECIDGAVKGQYSITRRSAGLPLMLISALIGSNESSSGIVLANDCLMRLIDLCDDKNSFIENDEWFDPPIVHCLNLIRQMCQSPPLQTALQPQYGNVILITLSQFSSQNWSVRNAALQLFSTMLSRVTSATKGTSFSPAFTEFISVYPQLWLPILKIIRNVNDNDRRFLKYQTLIPVLTLLANFRYSNKNLLPTDIHLDELVIHFWSLLGCPLIQVRRLAARCLVNYLPNSGDLIHIIQSNTRLIPLLTIPGAILSVKTLSGLPFNQQHGELILLKLVLKKLRLFDGQLFCVIDSMIQYAELLTQRKCWILLENVFEVLQVLRIPSDYFKTVESFAIGKFYNLLGSHLETVNISRLSALAATIKLIGSLSISTDSISSSLFDFTHQDALQQICIDFDQYSHKYEKSLILSFFKVHFASLIAAVHKSLQYYSEFFSPYLLQILCQVIDQFPRICAPHNIDFMDFLCQLYSTMEKYPLVTETVVNTCARVITWIYVTPRFNDNDSNIFLKASQNQIFEWLKRIEKTADFCSVESSRMSAAQNILILVGTDFLDLLLCHWPEKLATLITFGCFDEDKSIRETYRLFLCRFICASENREDQYVCSVMKMIDLKIMYRMISERSHYPVGAILISVWKTLVLHQRDFFQIVLLQQLKDVLYEPVPSNIYVEFLLIVEVLYTELKTVLADVDKTLLVDLKNSHPTRFLSTSEMVSNSAASFLSQSEILIRILCEN